MSDTLCDAPESYTVAAGTPVLARSMLVIERTMECSPVSHFRPTCENRLSVDAEVPDAWL